MIPFPIKALLCIVLVSACQTKIKQGTIGFGGFGDSLMLGPQYDKTLFWEPHDWFGNADGGKVLTVQTRYDQCLSGSKSQYRSVAAMGARISDLPRQVRAMKNRLEDPGSLRFAALSIGSNDLCRLEPGDDQGIDAYRIQLVNHINDILLSFPKVKLLVLEIPDLSNLWQGHKMRCQERWRWGQCPLLSYGRLDEVDASRWVRRATNLLNQAMLDINGERIKMIPLTEHIQEVNLQPFDCFHPSVKGLERLSQVAWSPKWFACSPN
ncbi:MAG: hypothetical protein HRU19_02315 [Pseudobacteriovorax sp.]|nr:hypothetical protein [Pseudobacteriovorax sp.]